MKLHINHQRKLLSKKYILEIKERVCTCMCLCVYIYVYMSSCCHACMYARLFICMLAYVYACICVCLWEGEYIHECMYVSVCMSLCTRMCVWRCKFVSQVITAVLDLVFYFVSRLSHHSVCAILAGLGASEDNPVCFPSHFKTLEITGVHSIACFMWSLGI